MIARPDRDQSLLNSPLRNAEAAKNGTPINMLITVAVNDSPARDTPLLTATEEIPKLNAENRAKTKPFSINIPNLLDVIPRILVMLPIPTKVNTVLQALSMFGHNVTEFFPQNHLSKVITTFRTPKYEALK